MYPLKKAVFYWNTADINRLFCLPGRQKQTSNTFQTVLKQRSMAVLLLFNSKDAFFWTRSPKRSPTLGCELINSSVSIVSGAKASWCSKSILGSDLRKCWYAKLKIEHSSSSVGGFDSVGACFCAQGWLFDSSSSRRSRTSIMKQGWPQLPGKRHLQHLVSPKSH